MNKAVVLYILGWILLFEAVLLTLPLVTAFIYSEQNSALAFIISINEDKPSNLDNLSTKLFTIHPP